MDPPEYPPFLHGNIGLGHSTPPTSCFSGAYLLGAPQVQQRERKNAYLIEDYSSSEEDEESYMQGKKREARRTRRLSRRMGRGTMNIFDARKRVLLESKRTPLEKENARQIANLGPGGCPACMSNPCKRTPVVNVEVSLLLSARCRNRQYELGHHINDRLPSGEMGPGSQDSSSHLRYVLEYVCHIEK